MIRFNGKLLQYQGGLISDGDFHAIGLPSVRINGVPVALQGQLSVGHSGFPPTLAVGGTPTFTINGVPIIVEGDLYAPHTNGSETHVGVASPIPL